MLSLSPWIRFPVYALLVWSASTMTLLSPADADEPASNSCSTTPKPEAQTAPPAVKAPSPLDDERFAFKTFTDPALGRLPYRLRLPSNFDSKKGPYPLLIFLHGAGERGTDNRAQLVHGKPLMEQAADRYGCLVVAPQCPPEKLWAGHHWSDENLSLTAQPSGPMRLLMKLIDQMETDYPIDSDRVYIMGLSMGGFGTWDAIQRYPERFAAAAPICGGGDPALVERIKNTPIWAFHGEIDSVVPVSRSRRMVDGLKKLGGKIRYSEYPGVYHGSWNNAFAEPELLDWMTGQKRASDQ